MSAGELIRSDRMAAGFTLRAVAAQVGVHHTHLSHVEHDRYRPGPGLLRALADLYGGDVRSYMVRLGMLPPRLLERAAESPEFCSLLWDIAETKPSKLARMFPDRVW